MPSAPATRPRARLRPPGSPLPRAVAAPATADPLAIPALAGVPRTLTLAPDPTAKSGTDWPREINRFVRAGILSAENRVPDTETNPTQAFLQLAAQRAFPPVPKLRQASIHANYVVEKETLGALADPNEGWDSHHDQGRERDRFGPWLVVHCEGHGLAYIGAVAEHLEQRHPGLGAWLCRLLLSPFTISPNHYLDVVGSCWWQGERDETMAREEDPEWENRPTRAQFDALYPKWAWEHGSLSTDWRRRVRQLQRLLDLDVSPLLTDAGRRRLDWSHTWRYLGYQRWHPYLFFWRRDDMVQAAFDEEANLAGQCGTQSNVAAILYAGDLKASAARLADVWAVLTTFDRLVEAIQHYRKQHKLA